MRAMFPNIKFRIKPVLNIFVFVLACLLCFGAACSEEETISYSGKSEDKFEMQFIVCPEGDLIRIKAYEPNGKSHVKSFGIAKEELSADHYVRLAEVSKMDGLVDANGKSWDLPTLEELLERYLKQRELSNPQEKKAFKKKVYETYKLSNGKTSSRLPVFALTFTEAKRTCLVLQNAIGKKNSDSFFIESITLPTEDQWQYAARAVDKKHPQEDLNFQAWPTPLQVETYANENSSRKRLIRESNLHYAFIMKISGGNMKDLKIKGLAPKAIDISSSKKILEALEKTELFYNRIRSEMVKYEKLSPEEKQKHPNTYGRTFRFVRNSHDVLIYRLLEILRCTAKAEEEIPIAFEKPHLDTLGAKGKARSFHSVIPVQKEIDLLRTVNNQVKDKDCSIRNHWGLRHTSGNVCEWVLYSGEKPAVAGGGFTDSSSNWKRSLIWNISEKTSSEEEFAGLRFVQIKKFKINEYRKLLVKMMNDSINPLANRQKKTDTLKKVLQDAEKFIEGDQYSDYVTPEFNFVIAYIDPEDSLETRRIRGIAAANYPKELLKVQAGVSSKIFKQEYDDFLNQLAFLETEGGGKK